MTVITASLPKSLWTSSPSFPVYILLFNKWPLVDSARVKALIKPPWLDRKELSKVYFPFELYQSFINGKLPVRFIHLLKLGCYQGQEWFNFCSIYCNQLSQPWGLGCCLLNVSIAESGGIDPWTLR